MLGLFVLVASALHQPPGLGFGAPVFPAVIPLPVGFRAGRDRHWYRYREPLQLVATRTMRFERVLGGLLNTRRLYGTDQEVGGESGWASGEHGVYAGRPNSGRIVPRGPERIVRAAICEPFDAESIPRLAGACREPRLRLVSLLLVRRTQARDGTTT